MADTQKLKYTTIANVGYVDGPAPGGMARLWAHFVLIDAPRPAVTERSGILDSVRQIRGLTFGGLSVFTYWIRPECEVRLETNDGGSISFLKSDGALQPMDSGVRIIADDLTLSVVRDNYNKPIDVRQVEVDSCPFGDEVDRQILEFYERGGCPLVRWGLTEQVRAIVA